MTFYISSNNFLLNNSQDQKKNIKNKKEEIYSTSVQVNDGMKIT